jgi:hypothetical protein
MSRRSHPHRGARRVIRYESWTNIGLHEEPRSYAPGDRLVDGHIGMIVPRIKARADLLAELAAMCQHDERHEETGRDVGRLSVGDVVVVEQGSAWSLAPIGVVPVNVDTEDQIRDGRSWTEVLDDDLAISFTPISKTIAQLSPTTADSGKPPTKRATCSHSLRGRRREPLVAPVSRATTALFGAAVVNHGEHWWPSTPHD